LVLANDFGFPKIKKYLQERLASAPPKIPKTLQEAVDKNDRERLIALLDGGADINAANNMGWKPLHLAAYLDRPEMVAVLLERGADYRAKDHHNCTPLQFAELSSREVHLLIIYKLFDIK